MIAAMLGSIIAMGIVGNPDNRGGQAGAFDPAFPLTFMIVLVTATAAIPATGWSLAVLTPALAAIALGAASLVAPAAASTEALPFRDDAFDAVTSPDVLC